MKESSSENQQFISTIRMAIRIVGVVVLLILGSVVFLILKPNFSGLYSTDQSTSSKWTPPDFKTIPKNETGKLISYGRDLVIHTGHYLGPNGTVRKISNGMTCQNCHLEAGTKPFGNNFGAVASTYPKYRPRYGSIESIEKRVNDCFERSLNGRTLDSSSLEMRAIVAYLTWVGKDVVKGESPEGTGPISLPFLERAADYKKGRKVYIQQCRACHGANGEGQRNTDSVSWKNPPVWGPESYNVGAGLFRLSRFAGFVKENMPIGVTMDAPQLTNEEAWDVAAYVNSMPRPYKSLTKDWPKLWEKPPDYPFGPYTDTFTTAQHKYGPFKPILEVQKKMMLNNSVNKEKN